MWAAQLINCQPRKWVSSSGLGTMGFGLPAAIGAQVANPDQEMLLYKWRFEYSNEYSRTRELLHNMN